MKKTLILTICAAIVALACGCTSASESPQIAATTLPVYEFTASLCRNTGISVTRLITEEISCLHNYTLHTSQMRVIEGAELIVISGGGLEEFLEDALGPADAMIDASENIQLLCGSEHDHEEEHEGHSHENDPHIWLSPANAKIMVQNICQGLENAYPEYSETFQKNQSELIEKLDVLQAYGEEQLSGLSCRELITFHDGFAYFADAFDLTVLRAVEEESGSEVSAAELIELIDMVESYHLPAIFTERSGSTSAASIISAETGAEVFSLDMAIVGDSYFEAMYHNIDTIKEALG